MERQRSVDVCVARGCDMIYVVYRDLDTLTPGIIMCCVASSRAATCEELSYPGFGTVTVSGQSVGDTATYECWSGFDLVGLPTQTCAQTSPGSADWSGVAPICRRMYSLPV